MPRRPHLSLAVTGGFGAALLLTTALVAPIIPTMTAAAAEPPAAQAPARGEVAFSIPPQSLDSALTAFADQAGLRLLFRSEDVAGLRSEGLTQRMLPDDALRRLLAGSGLTWRRVGPNTVTLDKTAAGDGAMQLDPVTVEGVGRVTGEETALSPVVGYVAKRAASATKTDTPIAETPQSISVVTRDDMDARAARDVGQALGYTAGLTTGSRGEISAFGGSNVIMRGFGGDGTAGASSNEYMDGLRMQGTNYAVSNLDPYLFERIEAVKGPASVLYGQITPGGVINTVSKRPTADPLAEVRLGAGGRDHFDGAFDLGGGVLGDHVLLRVTGMALKEDLQAVLSDRERQAVAPALTLRTGEGTTLTLLAAYQKDDINGSPLNYVPASGSVLGNPNGKISSELNTGDPNFNNWLRRVTALGYQFEHAFLDNLKFRQNLRYTRNELDWKTVYASSLAANGRTLNRSVFSARENADSLAMDNQVQAEFETGPLRHTMLAGFDLQRQSRDTLRAGGTGPTLDLFNPIYHQTIATPTVYQYIETVERQNGYYLQDQIKLGDLSVVAGARRDRAQAEARNLRTGSVTPMDDSANTYRVGALYAFPNGLSPYVSYAESFEPTSGSDIKGSPFVPATGTQYEAGVKYQPPGINSFVTASVFHLTQQNVTTPDPANTNYSVQTGEIRTRGLELEGKASLPLGLDLTAAYTRLDAKVTKSNSTDLGRKRVAIPQDSFSVWGDYTRRDGDARGLGAGLGVRFVGDSPGDTLNSFDVPAYAVFDAALHYDLGAENPSLAGWKAAINVNNLFDEEYVASCIRATSCYWGLRRTVLGTVSYRW